MPTQPPPPQVYQPLPQPSYQPPYQTAPPLGYGPVVGYPPLAKIDGGDCRDVLGIVSFVAYVLALATAPLGLTLSIIAFRRITAHPAQLRGKGIAIAGIVCSAIVCALFILGFIYGIVHAANGSAPAVTGT